MEPTVSEGNLVLIRKLNSAELIDGVTAGDILIFKQLSNNQDFLIKRCLGLPNDTLKDFNELIVPYNGFSIYKDSIDSDLYHKTCDRYEENCMKNPMLFTRDYFFMVGDNRQVSFDSRHYGFIPKELIIGRVKYKVY